MVSRTHAIEILSVLITSVVLGYIGVVAGINLVAIDTPPPSATETIKVIERFTGHSNIQTDLPLLIRTAQQ